MLPHECQVTSCFKYGFYGAVYKLFWKEAGSGQRGRIKENEIMLALKEARRLNPCVYALLKHVIREMLQK